MKEIIDKLEKESTEYKERVKKIEAKLQGDAMISENQFNLLMVQRSMLISLARIVDCRIKDFKHNKKWN